MHKYYHIKKQLIRSKSKRIIMSILVFALTQALGSKVITKINSLHILITGKNNSSKWEIRQQFRQL
jgi:hypothetical protein